MTTVYFRWKKETKGAEVYQEVNSEGQELDFSNGAVVGSLYVRKAAIKGARPEILEIDLDI